MGWTHTRALHLRGFLQEPSLAFDCSLPLNFKEYNVIFPGPYSTALSTETGLKIPELLGTQGKSIDSLILQNLVLISDKKTCTLLQLIAAQMMYSRWFFFSYLCNDKMRSVEKTKRNKIGVE